MHLLITTFCLLISCYSNAQFTRGTHFVASSVGSFFMNTGKTEYTFPSVLSQNYQIESRSKSIVFVPSYGRFFTRNLALGIALNARTSCSGNKKVAQNGNTFQNDQSRALNIGAGAFVRYYLAEKSTILPYSQLSIDMGAVNQKTSGYYFEETPLTRFDYESQSTGGFYSNLSFTVGITKMLSHYTGVDFYVGYSLLSQKMKESFTTLVDYDNNSTLDETRKAESRSKVTNNGVFIGIGFQVFLAPCTKKSK